MLPRRAKSDLVFGLLVLVTVLGTAITNWLVDVVDQTGGSFFHEVVIVEGTGITALIGVAVRLGRNRKRDYWRLREALALPAIHSTATAAAGTAARVAARVRRVIFPCVAIARFLLGLRGGQARRGVRMPCRAACFVTRESHGSRGNSAWAVPRLAKRR